MLLKIHELPHHVKHALKPIYLISGDEPMQSLEASMLIREAAKTQDFTEKEIHFIDTKFPWSSLLEKSGTMSLFGDKKILDLRLEKLPDKAAQEILYELCSQVDEATLVLISTPKIPKKNQSQKWIKEIISQGVFIQVWPISQEHLPQWLQQRTKNNQRQLNSDAALFLAQSTQGNLFAAKQELDKIFFVTEPGSEISLSLIKEQVFDNARFTTWELLDEAISGHSQKLPRILKRLKQEKTEPMILAKMIQKECLLLEKLSFQLSQGNSLGQVFKNARIWSNKQAVYSPALKRFSFSGWQKLWMKGLHLEKIIIGSVKANFWDECLDLLLMISGFMLWTPKQKMGSSNSSKKSNEIVAAIKSSLNEH